jgi:hypothetical protein
MDREVWNNLMMKMIKKSNKKDNNLSCIEKNVNFNFLF